MYSGVWGGYCRNQHEIHETKAKEEPYIASVEGCELHKRSFLQLSASRNQTVTFSQETLDISKVLRNIHVNYV